MKFALWLIIDLKISPSVSVSLSLFVSQSLSPCVPQSLRLSVSQSLSPCVPQSLRPSVLMSLALCVFQFFLDVGELLSDMDEAFDDFTGFGGTVLVFH